MQVALTSVLFTWRNALTCIGNSQRSLCGYQDSRVLVFLGSSVYLLTGGEGGLCVCSFPKCTNDLTFCYFLQNTSKKRNRRLQSCVVPTKTNAGGQSCWNRLWAMPRPELPKWRMSCGRNGPMWRKWRGYSRRWGSSRQPVRSGSSWNCAYALVWSRNWRCCGLSRWDESQATAKVVGQATVCLKTWRASGTVPFRWSMAPNSCKWLSNFTLLEFKRKLLYNIRLATHTQNNAWILWNVSMDKDFWLLATTLSLQPQMPF